MVASSTCIAEQESADGYKIGRILNHACFELSHLSTTPRIYQTCATCRLEQLPILTRLPSNIAGISLPENMWSDTIINRCSRCGLLFPSRARPENLPERYSRFQPPNRVNIGLVLDYSFCDVCRQEDLRTSSSEASIKTLPSFRTWCAANSELQTDEAAVVETVLDVDIKNFCEYLRNGTFHERHLQIFQDAVEAIHAVERRNFDFEPWAQPYLCRFRRWSKIREKNGVFFGDDQVLAAGAPRSSWLTSLSRLANG